MIEDTQKRTVYVTVGIPASGKSTWAREKAQGVDGVVIERDMLREELFNCSRSSYKFTKAKEQKVTDEARRRTESYLLANTPVILSDTNLNSNRREAMVAHIKDFGRTHGFPVEVIEVPFDVPLKDCIKRNIQRTHTVPESVLIRMEKDMREYLGKYTHDHNNPEKLPECILVDIDGTVADMAGKRSPFEWDKVGGDLPKKHIVNMVNLLMEDYFYNHSEENPLPEVIFMSGRDSACREETENWLYLNIRPYMHGCGKLFMRPEGDNRPDTIIKEELFDNHIKGKYHVSMVIDDRKCMVQHWQSMGFNVMDVGNGVSDF